MSWTDQGSLFFVLLAYRDNKLNSYKSPSSLQASLLPTAGSGEGFVWQHSIPKIAGSCGFTAIRKREHLSLTCFQLFTSGSGIAADNARSNGRCRDIS